MANALYPKAVQRFMDALIDLPTDTIKVSGVTSAYIYSSAHEYYSSLAGVSFTATLAGKTITDGVFDANDVVLTGLTPGPTVNALVIWKDTGNAATSPLIYYADTFASGVPISVTLTGAQVTITWSDLDSRIFRL